MCVSVTFYRISIYCLLNCLAYMYFLKLEETLVFVSEFLGTRGLLDKIFYVLSLRAIPVQFQGLKIARPPLDC